MRFCSVHLREISRSNLTSRSFIPFLLRSSRVLNGFKPQRFKSPNEISTPRVLAGACTVQQTYYPPLPTREMFPIGHGTLPYRPRPGTGGRGRALPGAGGRCHPPLHLYGEILPATAGHCHALPGMSFTLPPARTCAISKGVLEA